MGDRSCVLRCRGQLYKITQICQRVSERSFSRTLRNFCLRSSLTNNFARIVADFLHAFASFVRFPTSRHPPFHVLASRPNALDSTCKTANIDVMNFQSAPSRRSLWPDPSDGIPNRKIYMAFRPKYTFESSCKINRCGYSCTIYFIESILLRFLAPFHAHVKLWNTNFLYIRAVKSPKQLTTYYIIKV